MPTFVNQEKKKVLSKLERRPAAVPSGNQHVDECHGTMDLAGAIDGVKLEDRKAESEPPT